MDGEKKGSLPGYLLPKHEDNGLCVNDLIGW